MSDEKKLLLNDRQIRQKLYRIAYQICEDHLKEKQIILVGIEERGSVLAKELENILKEIDMVAVSRGSLKVDKDNPYGTPVTCTVSEPDYKNGNIIIVDDVLNSGKTLMYAVKHFLCVPVRRISVMSLVNRLHRRYPIRADYVGLSLSTTMQEHISFEIGADGKFAAYLED